MKWPEQVIVLKPDDFVLGPMRCGERFCLIGWRRNIFGTGELWNEARMVMNKCIEAAGARDIVDGRTPNTPANRRLAADLWQQFLDDLGYTEPGPTVEM